VARNQRGFTIIELLVVVSVIAILALIAFTVYHNVQSRSRLAKAQADTRTLQSKLMLKLFKFFDAQIMACSLLNNSTERAVLFFRPLPKGALKFRLDGKKLKGKWTLVRIKGKDPREEGKTWLLIKERDEFVRSSKVYSITEDRPESVTTGRTLEQIAADRDRVWNSNRGMAAELRAGSARASRAARAEKAKAAPAAARRPAAVRRDLAAAAAAIKGARKAPLPAKMAAQLATLVDQPPKGAEWLHEMKFDGYRILARLQDGRARLWSRNGKDWTAHFPAVAAAVEALPLRTALLDGEVAIVLPSGTTSFQALQNALAGQDQGQLAYFLFDLVHLEGYSLARAALEERKTLLKELLGPPTPESPLRYSDHVRGSGEEFFEQACGLGIEGIVSKLADSTYDSTRNKSWLKVKCNKQQEFAIVGTHHCQMDDRDSARRFLASMRKVSWSIQVESGRDSSSNCAAICGSLQLTGHSSKIAQNDCVL